MLNRVARQIGIGLEIQLLQNPGSVGADGFDAEGELVGNLRDCAAAGNQTERLILSIGQRAMERLVVITVVMNRRSQKLRHTCFVVSAFIIALLPLSSATHSFVS